jgi:hypothetical protein
MTDSAAPAMPETPLREVAPLERAGRWYHAFQRFLLQHQALAPFAQLLGAREALGLSAKQMHDLHYKGIGFLHWRLDAKLRRQFIAAIDAFARSQYQVDPFGPPPSHDVAAAVTALDRDGHAELPPVDPAVVADLLAWFGREGLQPPKEEGGRGDEAPVPASELRRSYNLGYVPRGHVLRAPHLFDLATDPASLETARRHLGAPPILINVTAWRSFAGEEGAKEARAAQQFHFDLDDYRFCKLFVYLTDVDAAGGPHVFVPTTHRPEVIAAKRPPEGTAEREAFDAWYFKSLRKSEAEVERWLGLTPRALTGPAGTRLLVNTEGIHRGAPPERTDRWVLQLVYGVSPFVQWGDRFEAPRYDGPEGYALQLLFSDLAAGR